MTKAEIYHSIHKEWQLQKSANILNESSLVSGQSSKETQSRVKHRALENNVKKLEQCKSEFSRLSNDVKELEKKVGKSQEDKEKLKT